MNKYLNNNAGYIISVSGVAIILLWLGIFKFTPTEAAGIAPLAKHSFLMQWMYPIAGIQGVSNFVGTFEIVTGIALLVQFFWQRAALIAGALSAIIFIVTLSFLFTTPGTFKTIDGVPTTDFFILKDMMAFGISLMIMQRGKTSTKV